MQFQIPCPCCLRYTSTPVPAVPAVPETETYQTTTLKHQVLLLRHFTSNPPWHKNLSLGHFHCAHLPRIAVVTPALWDFRPRMTQIRVVTWILASHGRWVYTCDVCQNVYPHIHAIDACFVKIWLFKNVQDVFGCRFRGNSGSTQCITISVDRITAFISKHRIFAFMSWVVVDSLQKSVQCFSWTILVYVYMYVYVKIYMYV